MLDLYDICFIGIGRVGYLALKYFVEKHSDYKILALDSNPLKKEVLNRLNGDIVFETIKSPGEAISKIRGLNLVATALPSSIAYSYVSELLNNGLNVVDVSYIEEDPYTLSETCIRKKVFYIPDAGFAPGFSNLYVGYIQSIHRELDEVAIHVGGIPIKPVEPIYYQITWNPVDLLEEYVRPARIVVNKSIRKVDPLENIVEVNIPNLGLYQGFYSDGLRTLIRNINVRNMFEITIRYPGHLDVMRVLKKLGFFDKEPIAVDNFMIKPIEYTARILEKNLKQTIPDIAILYIVVKTIDKKIYENLSTLIGDVNESATAKYTALVFYKTIDIVINGFEQGIHPLEDFYMFYKDYLEYLMSKGVVFKEQIK